jgi:cytochrome c-type biogenesis protein CcmF
MIAEVGHFALVLALVVAMVQASVPMVGAARNNEVWMALCRPAAIAQFLLVALSFLCLTYAFVTSDFSVITVAQNSHTDKPLI